MSVVAVVNMRRKRLIEAFKLNGATSVEMAVTLQEIGEKWDLAGIPSLRERAVKMDTEFLLKRGKINKTEDGKYYLS